MQLKIIRFQLISLSFLTITSFIYFFYSENLPDHLYTINSANSDPGFIAYYLTSILAIVGQYTGPWLVSLLATLVVLYSFLFSRKESRFDFLVVFSLSTLFISAFMIFFPGFLGEGLQLILSKHVSTLGLVFILIISALVSFALGLRSSLKDTLVLLQGSLQKIRGTWNHYRENIGNGINKKISIEKPSEKFAKLQNIVGDKLKRDKKEIKKDVGTNLNLDTTKIEPEEKPKTNTVLKPKKTASQNTSPVFEPSDLIACVGRKDHTSKSSGPSNKYFEEIIERIEDKLSDFRIEGNIINILKGPVVDTFELELGAGVKVSKVTRITEDLSLALKGTPIRMVYPMKGKHTIGIEIPRSPREIIYLDEVLDVEEFTGSDLKLPIAMGKDAFGDPFVIDLPAMPHMLVAGATGAGKSVFINTLLVSLLVRNSPDKLRLILIDPKQLELALYADLPHLILPVITEASMASLSLLWAIEEMERRYTLLKELGVRSLERYNEKIKEVDEEVIAKVKHLYEGRGNALELPFIVIIVDEFADLVLTKKGKDIETNICRLAAKARACGIHLIIATQRPSVDVITGLIKANFPTRVSFRVTASIDSRTILNSMGAEKLLGRGDMLYKHGIEMKRVHSAYVDENEIETLVAKLISLPQDYYQDAMEFIENGGELEAGPGGGIDRDMDGAAVDPLYKDAVKIVCEYRTASASMLQRRLRIGYNRAANLIELMESKGVVGPQQGSKPRQVLMGSI
ncbi:MAG: DNA translocase FtsK [Bacteriovoracaceae bacterium]|jgi:DNA segregation ATPase FtsK/SpoIIIE, S-DNA-T family|nr:DNA translocase FtsK [Bacteriovoracaceae bacterium]